MFSNFQAQKLVDGMTLGGKKFHLRAHVVVLEGVMVGEGEERGEGFEFYAHLDYEVRIAALKKGLFGYSNLI